MLLSADGNVQNSCWLNKGDVTREKIDAEKGRVHIIWQEIPGGELKLSRRAMTKLCTGIAKGIVDIVDYAKIFPREQQDILDALNAFSGEASTNRSRKQKAE